MKKFISNILVFLILFIFSNGLLSLRYFSIVKDNLDFKLYNEYFQRRDSLDLVFVGGSEALDGIDDQKFNSALNVGSHGLSFEEAFYIIKQLKKDSIKNIALVISAPNFFRTNREPIKTEIFYNSPWIDLNPFERYIYDNSKLSKIFFKPQLSVFDCDNQNLDCYKKHASRVGHFKNDQINYGEKYYTKIIELFLNDRLSQLYLIYLPVTPLYDSLASHSQPYNNYKSKVKENCKKHNFIFIDFQKIFIDHQNPYQYFKDTNHLNLRGRDTTSIILKNYIDQL